MSSNENKTHNYEGLKNAGEDSNFFERTVAEVLGVSSCFQPNLAVIFLTSVWNSAGLKGIVNECAH